MTSHCPRASDGRTEFRRRARACGEGRASADGHASPVRAHARGSGGGSRVVPRAHGHDGRRRGGAVGSGYVYQGHVNNNPSSALEASADDLDTLYGITGGITDTTGGNSQRVLYLSSGDVIWDIVGNVWEMTSDTIDGAQPGANGYAWRQYTAITNWGNLPLDSRPSALAGMEALSDIGSWDSSQGIGQIYSDLSSTSTRAIMRSGNWSGTNTRGVLTLHAGLGTGSVNSSVGFRVVK